MILHLLPFFRFLLPKWVSAIALWPFIIIKNSKGLNKEVLLNHEKIHLRQQLELLIVIFYVIYFGEYLYYRIKLKNADMAYRSISFEREAYQNDKNLEYLQGRKIYAMWRK